MRLRPRPWNPIGASKDMAELCRQRPRAVAYGLLSEAPAPITAESTGD